METLCLFPPPPARAPLSSPRTAARLRRRRACVPGCAHRPWGSGRGQGSTSCQAGGRNTTSRSQSSFPSNKSRLGLGESTANGDAHPAPLQLPTGKDLGAAAWKNKSHEATLRVQRCSPGLGSDQRIKDLPLPNTRYRCGQCPPRASLGSPAPSYSSSTKWEKKTLLLPPREGNCSDQRPPFSPPLSPPSFSAPLSPLHPPTLLWGPEEGPDYPLLINAT